MQTLSTRCSKKSKWDAAGIKFAVQDHHTKNHRESGADAFSTAEKLQRKEARFVKSKTDAKMGSEQLTGQKGVVYCHRQCRIQSVAHCVMLNHSAGHQLRFSGSAFAGKREKG